MGAAGNRCRSVVAHRGVVNRGGCGGKKMSQQRVGVPFVDAPGLSRAPFVVDVPPGTEGGKLHHLGRGKPRAARRG